MEVNQTEDGKQVDGNPKPDGVHSKTTDIEKWWRWFLDDKLYRGLMITEVPTSGIERNEFDKPMIVLAEVKDSKKTSSGKIIVKGRPVILGFVYDPDDGKWVVSMINKKNGEYRPQWSIPVEDLVGYESFVKSIRGEEFKPALSFDAKEGR